MKGILKMVTNVPIEMIDSTGCTDIGIITHIDDTFDMSYVTRVFAVNEYASIINANNLISRIKSDMIKDE